MEGIWSVGGRGQRQCSFGQKAARDSPWQTKPTLVRHTTCPFLLQHSVGLPDIHAGYGFAIGE